MRLLAAGLLAEAGLAARMARADSVSPAPGPVRLSWEPARVVLGTVDEVVLRVEVAPDATGLALFTSAGRVGAPTLVAPGVFRAVYVPPHQKLPREVILVARARGAGGPIEGWTVLPLWGRGEAEVRTRAHAPVSVQAGGETFGPVLADASGVARVPITVPPGVEAASFGSRRIDLGVPPWPYVHAVTPRAELQADREESVEVWLYLSRLPGAPVRPPGPFTFQVSRGSVSPPVEREPGVFLARWTVPPGPQGPLELRGGVEGDDRWSLDARVEARPGPARSFELRVEPEEVVASEEARVRVEVSVRDGAGNPTRADTRLESELSPAVALVEQRAGEYAARLELPARFAGRDTLALRLFAEGSTAPVATHPVRLRAGALDQVRLEPVRPVLVADGRSEAVWRIFVEDRFGNPVVEPRPEPRLAGGLTGTLVPGPPGRYELRYVPPESRVDERSEVDVRVGPLSARGTLSLLRRSVLTLAPRVGAMTNLTDVRALTAGLRLEAWPVRAWPAVGLWLDAGYLRFSRGGSLEVSGFRGDNEILDTSLALGLRTPREYAIQGWASAGVGVARVRSQVRWDEGGVLEQAAFVLGAQATVGVGARAGPGQPFIEVRVSRFADPALPVLRGVLQGPGLQVGYRLELF